MPSRQLKDRHTIASFAGVAEPENDLTIEELAAETGMTVRNIRSHRARGLLPAPEVRDRVGYYGPRHLARLRMIQELQADGFNLKGIERLLGQNMGAAEQFLSFRRALDSSTTSSRAPSPARSSTRASAPTATTC